MRLCVVAKFAAVVISAWTVARIDNRLYTTLIVTKVACRVFVVYKIVSTFVLVVTRSWPVRYFVFAFSAKHMRLSVVAKFAAVVISAWTVARVDNRLYTSLIVAKVICWVSIVN